MSEATAKPVDEKKDEELDPLEAGQVAGGLNPQPLPPGRGQS
jgi:hypothetical protein